jgi:alkyl hydroperoxide reductase subunit AhpC
MTTLCLDLALEDSCGQDFHKWLGGAWALLFSNPEDFQPQGREGKHWLPRIRQAFNVRAARALAVKRDGPPESTWLDELHLDRQLLRLREPPFAAADQVSFAARVLRGELLTLASRFVLIVDGSLKRRGVLKYGDGRIAVSALDLLASIDALRSHHAVARAA